MRSSIFLVCYLASAFLVHDASSTLAKRACACQCKPKTTAAPSTTTPSRATTTPRPATTTRPTTTTTVQPCQKRAKSDIWFILDASSSIGLTNWAHQTKFAADITQAFTIGVLDILFGCLIFNYDVTKIFDLNTYLDKTSLYNTIRGIQYPTGQGTFTYKGFKKIREDGLFSAAYGGRATASKIVIVMTDGQSSDKAKTIEEAELLKKEGVVIIAVGIGNAVDSSELQGMASDSSKVFTAENYELLDVIKNKLVNFTCDKASGL